MASQPKPQPFRGESPGKTQQKGKKSRTDFGHRFASGVGAEGMGTCGFSPGREILGKVDFLMRLVSCAWSIQLPTPPPFAQAHRTVRPAV